MSSLEQLVVFLGTIGSLFMLISAIGILRLPDALSRMHAVGKAATLGVSCLLLAAGLFFGGEQAIRMVALIVLFFVTAPIATTAMARAAYRRDRAIPKSLQNDAMADPRYISRQSNKQLNEKN